MLRAKMLVRINSPILAKCKNPKVAAELFTISKSDLMNLNFPNDDCIAISPANSQPSSQQGSSQNMSSQ